MGSAVQDIRALLVGEEIEKLCSIKGKLEGFDRYLKIAPVLKDRFMERFEAGSFDCVLFCYTRKGLIGSDMYERLPRSPDIPFIICSENDLNEIDKAESKISSDKQALLDDGSRVYKKIAKEIRKTVVKNWIDDTYRCLIEYSKHPIVILEGTNIVYANEPLAELVGLEDPEQLIGVDALDWIVEEDKELVMKTALNRQARKDEPRLYEITIRRADGELRRLEISATLINFRGKPASLDLPRDITGKARPDEPISLIDLERRDVELPEYPKVVVRGDTIVVIDQDNNEMVWDYEEDEAKAQEIAGDIQKGLRAIRHVRRRIVELLNELMEDLIKADITFDQVEQFLFEGYGDVQKMLARLYRYKKANTIEDNL